MTDSLYSSHNCEEVAHLALDLVFVWVHGAAPHPPRKKAVPATDFISAERKFTEVCAFARPLAELVAPPTMRHHAETSSTMIADLRLPHPILAQHFEARACELGKAKVVLVRADRPLCLGNWRSWPDFWPRRRAGGILRAIVRVSGSGPRPAATAVVRGDATSDSRVAGTAGHRGLPLDIRACLPGARQ
jgi:hypothetical protein